MLVSMIGYVVFFIVVFYFLIMRPQKQRQQQQESLVKGLQKGDKVVLSGGIHGRIASVKESTAMISIAENVKIEVDKSSVTTVLKRENEPAPATTTAT